jgi:hypothetical protein
VHFAPEVVVCVRAMLRVFDVLNVPSYSSSQLSGVPISNGVRETEKKEEVTALPLRNRSELFLKPLLAFVCEKQPQTVGRQHANMLRLIALHNPTSSPFRGASDEYGNATFRHREMR